MTETTGKLPLKHEPGPRPKVALVKDLLDRWVDACEVLDRPVMTELSRQLYRLGVSAVVRVNFRED